MHRLYRRPSYVRRYVEDTKVYTLLWRPLMPLTFRDFDNYHGEIWIPVK